MFDGATRGGGLVTAELESLRRGWPQPHGALVQRLVAHLAARDEVRAALLGGSLANGGSDEYSDIDLTVVCTAETRGGLLEGERLARDLGCLSAFRGDHLREPRLLICLFDPPLVHVDFKLVTPEEAGERVESRALLLCKDPALLPLVASEIFELPSPDRAWVEPRIWTWLHYGATKAARGEVFECLDLLAFLRGRVLGPMALLASGHSGLAVQGLRRFEANAPAYADALAQTVSQPDASSCLGALDAARVLYLELRDVLEWRVGDPRLEAAVADFLSRERAKRASGG